VGQGTAADTLARMRRIGLLGGMAWPSTEVYHRLLNQEVNRRLGGNHSARLVLWEDDFEHVAALQRAGRWDDAGDQLAAGAKSLVAAGAELIAICANTMHLVADQVRAAVDVPLVHLIEVVADAAQEAGLRRLGLLATDYTMTSSLYPDVCTPRGIDVLVPGPEDRAAVHASIYDELTRGVVTAHARAVAYEAALRLVEDGADAIVLGCTELALVLAPGDLAVPVIDTTALHCRALVDAALA